METPTSYIRICTFSRQVQRNSFCTNAFFDFQLHMLCTLYCRYVRMYNVYLHTQHYSPVGCYIMYVIVGTYMIHMQVCKCKLSFQSRQHVPYVCTYVHTYLLSNNENDFRLSFFKPSHFYIIRYWFMVECFLPEFQLIFKSVRNLRTNYIRTYLHFPNATISRSLYKYSVQNSKIYSFKVGIFI